MADRDVSQPVTLKKIEKTIEAAENSAKHRTIEARLAGYLLRNESASFYANSTGW
ncbi:hypothetical protein HBN61_17870 [Pseudomonas sp. WS 5071]|nr:hypothetical protein [Pseudomonas sp. WS 5071]